MSFHLLVAVAVLTAQYTPSQNVLQLHALHSAPIIVVVAAIAAAAVAVEAAVAIKVRQVRSVVCS
jgi:hypothetical protein